MPLVNLRYYERSRFFWDEPSASLEQAVLLPIQSRIEMGQDLKRLVDTLARDPTYPILFARAFGDRQITEERIGKALAQFVRSIVSFQSRYDEGRAVARSAREDFGNFTLQENRGKALFMRNCSTCHMQDGNEHLFVQTPANTRLQGNDDPTADGGVGDVTLRIVDLGAFKSPSLRNVEVTAPYGHGGRFATLGALIVHYSDNPISDPNLGYVFRPPLKFTASERAALVAFLKTLTDRACLADARFSNPFVESNVDGRKSVTDAVLTAGATLTRIGAAAGRATELVGSAVIAPEAPPLPSPPSADPIVRRLVSFDADGDRRISRHELPERMHGLVARGDANGDAALDPKEIRDLLNGIRPDRPRPHPPLPGQPPEGLRGVIRDLKLPPPTHAAALAIVGAHRPSGDVNASVDGILYAKMRTVLDDEQFENFVAAASRVPRRPRIDH